MARSAAAGGRPVSAVSAESVVRLRGPGRSEGDSGPRIFDRVGPAHRQKGEPLTAAEIAARSGSARTDDLTSATYDLFVTTGAIHSGHLVNLAVPPQPPEKDPVDIRAGLQRINVSFASIADGLLGRIATSQGFVCRFYLDSPRVQIAEFSVMANRPRLSLDLRRDQARGVGTGFRTEQLFYAQVLRGVIDGTLEQVLVDYFAGFGYADQSLLGAADQHELAVRAGPGIERDDDRPRSGPRRRGR